jgi:hypothetical protein
VVLDCGAKLHKRCASGYAPGGSGAETARARASVFVAPEVNEVTATVFTPEIVSSIIRLARAGRTSPEVAKSLGLNLGSLRFECSKRKISFREERKIGLGASGEALVLQITHDARAQLQSIGSRRGLTVEEMAAYLLDLIVTENLMDAILAEQAD